MDGIIRTVGLFFEKPSLGHAMLQAFLASHKMPTEKLLSVWQDHFGVELKDSSIELKDSCILYILN